MFPLSDSLITRKTPLITFLIIAANVWVFWHELSIGDSFINAYALIPARIELFNFSTWYPFGTSMFLHGGWFHLLSNMWFLWIFGDNVEDAFGSVRFLFFYVFAGIVAALTQFVFAPTSTIPMLGASGAIAGILGAYFMLYPRSRITSLVPIFFYITVIDIPASFYLPYWFLLQVFNGVGQVASGSLATSGGAAFLAHAGGFVAGILTAKLKRP